MNDELKNEIERINKIFPLKIWLNKGQMLTCIGRGNKWFDTRVNENRLDELPKFKEPIMGKRKKIRNPQYQFKVLEIAKFNIQ